jgi:hypothetical protein
MGLPILNDYIAIYIVLTMRYRAPAAYRSLKLRPPGPVRAGGGAGCVLYLAAQSRRVGRPAAAGWLVVAGWLPCVRRG